MRGVAIDPWDWLEMWFGFAFQFFGNTLRFGSWNLEFGLWISATGIVTVPPF
jgi:hypothetical protein